MENHHWMSIIWRLKNHQLLRLDGHYCRTTSRMTTISRQRPQSRWSYFVLNALRTTKYSWDEHKYSGKCGTRRVQLNWRHHNHRNSYIRILFDFSVLYYQYKYYDFSHKLYRIKHKQVQLWKKSSILWKSMGKYEGEIRQVRQMQPNTEQYS